MADDDVGIPFDEDAYYRERREKQALARTLVDDDRYRNVLPEERMRLYEQYAGDPEELDRELTWRAQRLDEARERRDIALRVDEQVRAEFEVREADYALRSRERRIAEGDSPVEDVEYYGRSRATPRDENYESMSEKYGEGDVTWAEFKPWYEEHERNRKQK